MKKEIDKFLEAEQSAIELVQALESLKKETLSYKTSTQELEKVRQQITELIHSFSIVLNSTQDLIEMLKSFGPEFISKISSLASQIDNESNDIKIEFKENIGGISKQLKRVGFLAIIGILVGIFSSIGIFILIFR